MDAYKRTLLVFFLVGLAVFCGSVYGFYEVDSQEAAQTAGGMETAPELSPEITVYVCGAVNRPGVVRLAARSRVIDAVKLCGGPLPTADLTGINMAKLLKDGEQVTLPEQEIIRENDAGAGSGAQAGQKEKGGAARGKVNLNTAEKEELDRLPGIGPAMAEAILEYRKTEGNFASVEDLKKVRGIGEAKFQKLKDKVAI